MEAMTREEYYDNVNGIGDLKEICDEMGYGNLDYVMTGYTILKDYVRDDTDNAFCDDWTLEEIGRALLSVYNDVYDEDWYYINGYLDYERLDLDWFEEERDEVFERLQEDGMIIEEIEEDEGVIDEDVSVYKIEDPCARKYEESTGEEVILTEEDNEENFIKFFSFDLSSVR